MGVRFPSIENGTFKGSVGAGGRVWPLGIKKKVGVAQDEGWRGKQVQPFRGLPFGLPLLWKASISEVSWRL